MTFDRYQDRCRASEGLWRHGPDTQDPGLHQAEHFFPASQKPPNQNFVEPDTPKFRIADNKQSRTIPLFRNRNASRRQGEITLRLYAAARTDENR